MNYLAVDVGGTSTRAAVVGEDGACIGYGTAGSGNPTSFDAPTAVAAIVAATLAATTQAETTLADLGAGVVGIAGASGETGTLLRGDLIKAGFPARLELEPDLLAAYYSGSLADEGYALVAGTGAAAVRIRGGAIEASGDGLGWLLGDAGSGFWIGHRGVLAAVGALDNRGPPTVLADLVVARLGLEPSTQRRRSGRQMSLQRAVQALYQLRPVELARFAPLVFEAEALGDDVASGIVDAACEALAATLAAIVAPDISGPLVLSGSILSQQPSVARRVAQAVFGGTGDGAPAITVSDGLAGAAVLALRHGGQTLDDTLLARARDSLAALR